MKFSMLMILGNTVLLIAANGPAKSVEFSASILWAAKDQTVPWVITLELADQT